MFTGIVEAIGEVKDVRADGTNRIFTIASPISNELKVDQSVAHDGVCLTVTRKDSATHDIVAVQETMEKTNLGQWKVGSQLNLERAIKMGARLDGHMVQGHVDGTGKCERIEEREGSWIFAFSFDERFTDLMVTKGSICINGVSLTVIDPGDTTFSVSIIPYTYSHTGFSNLSEGDLVNLEFDIIGKYVKRITQPHIS